MNKKIEDKITGGRQYRNIDITEFERRSAGDTERVVSGYASTFNQPYELYSMSFVGRKYIIREQVDPHAFDNTDMSDVIMQYDHEGRVFARISNGTLEVNVDSHGLYMTAHLGGTEIGRHLFEEIKGGYTTKMSFGFTVASEKREETREKNNDTGVETITILRTITGISKLYDVSAVSLPANDATSISARSWAAGVVDELQEEFQKRETQRKRIRIKTMIGE